jgi:hypothetical protein
MTRLSFPKGLRFNKLLAIVHYNICGSLNVKTHKYLKYFVTFIDDFSHYGYIYLMHKKYEVFINSQVYKNKVEDQLGRNISFFRSDCGREYMSDLFGNCLKQHSIIYQLFIPYTP